MYSLIFLGLVSSLLSLLLTPFIRNVAIRLNIVDHPDERKLHARPIPRVGGIAIIVSCIAAWLLLLATPLHAGDNIFRGFPVVFRLLPAIFIIFFTGLLDDLLNLRPWQKFLGQFLAAFAAVLGGVQISSLAGFPVSPWIGIPITVFWMVGCTNALNLIDGVDGLAAGVGLFASVTCLVSALLHNNIPLALATAPLAGALLGFLRFNFNPASIFLGDCGSLLIGFLLGCYGILWSTKSATLLGMTAPLMAFAIPLLDTSLSIMRRFLRLQPIFGADRGHIHHRLLALGHSPRRVAILVYCVSGVLATLSLLQSFARNSAAGLIIILFCAVAWIGIQHLGYVEFDTARRMILTGAFRRHLNAQLSLDSFEAELRDASTCEASWRVLQHWYGQFGFSEICMRLDGQFYERISPSDPPAGWQIQVPINDSDYLVLVREFDSSAQTSTVASFIDSAARILREKQMAPASPSSPQIEVTFDDEPGIPHGLDMSWEA